jgi:hypothetical protein
MIEIDVQARTSAIFREPMPSSAATRLPPLPFSTVSNRT